MAEWCGALRPDRRLGLWYARGTVWHERLLLYPAGGTYWGILKAGLDRYAEDVMGTVVDGCSRASTCTPDGAAPALVAGASHGFAAPEMIDWSGEAHPFSAVRRHSPLRDGDGAAGGGTATPPDDAPLVEAATAAPPLAPPAASPLGPPEGCAWAVTSPGRVAVGTEVGLAAGSVRLGEHHAMVQDRTVWELVEAVRIGMVDTSRDKRPHELEVRARDRLLSSTDRAYIEMMCLLSAICYAGSYEQANFASIVSIETLCRKVPQIVEAYSDIPKRAPRWGGPRHCTGVTGPMDVIDPALRTEVLRRNKEDRELENRDSRAAGVPPPRPPTPEVDEGLPSGSAGSAGRGCGRGRGRDAGGRGPGGRGDAGPGVRGGKGRGGSPTAPEGR